jgi:type IV pilus assembly protein PilC
MAEFVWEAKARTGELRKGSMEAESEDAVNQRLRGQQLQPTRSRGSSRR